MEPSYERAGARVSAIGGTSAEHLGSFVIWLGSQRYSAGYACIVARPALAFGRWFEGRGIDVEALTDDDIARYQRSRARRRPRRPETRRQERQALVLLLLFLREQGLCAAAASCATDIDRVAADFAQHLQRNYGLASAAVDTYARVARQFLAWRFGQADICRQGAKGASPSQQRCSEPCCPRVMRWTPRGARRSVDRGTCRPAIEPRKKFDPGADAVRFAEGNTHGRAIASARATRRGRRPWHARTLLAREPGDLQSDRRRQSWPAARLGKVRSRSR